MDGIIAHESQYFEDPVSVTPFPAEPAASTEEAAVSGAGSSQPDEVEEASERSSSPKRNSPASPVEEQESKRVKKLDESFSPIEESSSSEDGEISAVSDNDEPIEDPNLFVGVAEDDDVQSVAYEDSEFFEACKKGLSALKGRLTKAMNADKFDYIYPFFKIDDDLTDDFVSWCSENMIDWEKFRADGESSKRVDEE